MALAQVDLDYGYRMVIKPKFEAQDLQEAENEAATGEYEGSYVKVLGLPDGENVFLMANGVLNAAFSDQVVMVQIGLDG